MGVYLYHPVPPESGTPVPNAPSCHTQNKCMEVSHTKHGTTSVLHVYSNTISEVLRVSLYSLIRTTYFPKSHGVPNRTLSLSRPPPNSTTNRLSPLCPIDQNLSPTGFPQV